MVVGGARVLPTPCEVANLIPPSAMAPTVLSSSWPRAAGLVLGLKLDTVMLLLSRPRIRRRGLPCQRPETRSERETSANKAECSVYKGQGGGTPYNGAGRGYWGSAPCIRGQGVRGALLRE